MKLRNHKDFWAGIMFLAFGVLFIFWSRSYQLGTAAKMGPGYFPTVLGGIMAVLGLIIVLGAFSRSNEETRVERIGFKEIFLVLAGVAAFAFLLNYLGMMLSIIIMAFIAATASHEFKVKETAINSVVMCVLAYVFFAYLLEIQMPTWPSFLVSR
jgi:drug/metabolite transporter (DMT)-like permease